MHDEVQQAIRWFSECLSTAARRHTHLSGGAVHPNSGLDKVLRSRRPLGLRLLFLYADRLGPQDPLALDLRGDGLVGGIRTLSVLSHDSRYRRSRGRDDLHAV